MAGNTERRLYPRFQREGIGLTLSDPITRILDERPALVDISQGGARVITRAAILPGERVKFALRLPLGGVATGFGMVRWVADHGPAAGRRCGLEFVDFGWGGFGSLQSALAPRSVFARQDEFTFDGLVDGFLALACLVVGFLVLRAFALRPNPLSRGLDGMCAWNPVRRSGEDIALRKLKESVFGETGESAGTPGGGP